ncbi:MAG: hypothetical protein U9P37_00470, partial [Pseudomonadota bacterium]|nr:hypothetical protein [Pseudomonadota bacterium]
RNAHLLLIIVVAIGLLQNPAMLPPDPLQNTMSCFMDTGFFTGGEDVKTFAFQTILAVAVDGKVKAAVTMRKIRFSYFMPP